MWFLNFYISGAYLAILFYVLLLESNSFRNYLDTLLDTVKNDMNNSISIHNYILMNMITYLIGFGSWLSIFLLIFIIIDFIKYEKE